MRKRSKILALTMILVLVALSLAGCGSSNSSSGGKEVVKIAYIGPISGPNSAIGLGMRNSVQLAIDQANESGQLPFKLEMLPLDDASDPAQATNAANKAASDPKVAAAVAHFNSPCALATVHVFNKFGLPAVIPGAINDKITQNGYKEITRVISASSVQNTYAGKLVSEWGFKKFSIIHDQTDYGKTNADQFIEEIKKHGGEVLSYDGISVGQQDFSALLTSIKAKKPEMIFFGGLAQEAALIKRQINDLKIDTIFISDSGILSSTFNQVAGPAAEGTIAHGIGKPIEDLPGGQEFIKAYEARKFKEPYEAYGPFAYDATNIIIEALKKVGKDRKKLTEAIFNTKDFQGVLGTTTFDENGQTTNDLITTYISEDGKWVAYSKAKLQVVDKKLQKK